MPSCVVKKCTNYEKKFSKIHGISYHRFPADPIRNAVWTRILSVQRKEANFKSNKETRICSAHFTPKDFTFSEAGLRKLKLTAIPRLFAIKKQPDENGSSNDNNDEFVVPNLFDDLWIMDESNIAHPEVNAAVANNIDTTKKKKKSQSKENGTKTNVQNAEDIKINYDNLDKFGEQIAFLLKRIPRQLCKELQRSIVTLVKTTTKHYMKKVETVVPNITITSSVSKTVTGPNNTLSRHLLPQIQSDPVSKTVIGTNHTLSRHLLPRIQNPGDHDVEEITVNVEPDIHDKLANNDDPLQDSTETHLIKTVKTTQEKLPSIKLPKTFNLKPIKLGNIKKYKIVKIKNGDHKINRDKAKAILSNNPNAIVKIEIKESNMNVEADKGIHYDDDNNR